MNKKENNKKQFRLNWNQIIDTKRFWYHSMQPIKDFLCLAQDEKNSIH